MKRLTSGSEITQNCLSGLDSLNTSIYSLACSLPLFYLSSCLLNNIRQNQTLNTLDFFTPCLSCSPFLLHRICTVLLLFELKHLKNITPSRILWFNSGKEVFLTWLLCKYSGEVFSSSSSRDRMWPLAEAPSDLWGCLELRHFWTCWQSEGFVTSSRSAFDITHYLMLQNDFSRDCRVLKSTEKGFFILSSDIYCER